jgi:hypothetical protein
MHQLVLCARFALVLGVVLAASSPSLAAEQTRAASGSSESSADVPVISGMRAHLFEHKKALLSEDVLDPRYRGSWNSVAGPNAANATLVVVEVSGPPSGTFNGFFGPGTKYLVHLTAREAGASPKLLLDVSVVVPVLSTDGKAYLPFLVRQGGCAPVKVTAQLTGAQTRKPVERTLRFACGE